MESFTPTETNSPKQPVWYKTRAGIIFLSILGVLAIGGIGFAGMTGYYILKIRSGEGDALASVFNEEFTAAGNLSAKDKVIVDAAGLIRAHNPTLGSAASPITIIEFIDFECPFCQKEYPVFTQVIDTYGSAVRIVFKHFPLSNIHPNATAAAFAAACADEQKKFWEYYDLLFTEKQLDSASLFSYADILNLNKTTFENCLASERLAPQIQQDFEDGIVAGVRGTPTYFLNNRKIEGAIPFDMWEELILAELQKVKK